MNTSYTVNLTPLVLIWVALLVLLFFKPDPELIQQLKEWKELVLILSSVAAYTLGAIMNGIASKVLDPCERRCVFKGVKPSRSRSEIILRDPKAYSQLMKFLDAPRVLRSTIINIAISVILVFLHVRCANWLVCLLIVLLGFCIWGWYELDENYFVHLKTTFKALRKKAT